MHSCRTAHRVEEWGIIHAGVLDPGVFVLTQTSSDRLVRGIRCPER